jgi:hypothetical protein
MDRTSPRTSYRSALQCGHWKNRWVHVHNSSLFSAASPDSCYHQKIHSNTFKVSKVLRYFCVHRFGSRLHCFPFTILGRPHYILLFARMYCVVHARFTGPTRWSLPYLPYFFLFPGTFCAVDISLRRLEDTGTTDISGTLRKLRSQRSLSIQTIDQYIFTYLALLEYAQREGLIKDNDLKAFVKRFSDNWRKERPH